MSAFLINGKWLPLLALLAVILPNVSRYRSNTTSGNPAILAIGLCISTAFSTVMGNYAESGLVVWVSLALTMLTAYLLTGLLVSHQAEDRLFDIISDLGRVIILVSFAMAVLDINLGRGAGRFSGWSDNPNSLGMILAPILVILMARILEQRERWRYTYLPFLLAGLYVLALTGSRGAIGWVAISTLGFVLARVGLGIETSVALLVGLLIVGFGDTLFDYAVNLISRKAADPLSTSDVELLSGRSEVWALGMKLFVKEPISGYGIGSSGPILEHYEYLFKNHQGLHFHSSYLSALVESGLVGTMLLVLILLAAVVKGYRQTRGMRTEPMRVWAKSVLPWTLVLGALAHATVESWLLSAGNANTLLLWVLVFLITSGSHNTRRKGRPCARTALQSR